ncbi:MAG: hypothetical protein C4K60_09545 [Ideonella sp. MAG2]|nr:MAG: hypothetical protein C4K60_09545 [Ideonella sp. MAG2]
MVRPPRDAASLLVSYASYHRDPRNIATHMVGIPLSVFSLGALLSHPALLTLPTAWGPLTLTPAIVVWLLSTLWYLSRGLPGLGLVVSAANGLLLLAAALLLPAVDTLGLSCGAAALALGWLCQSIGHYYEGRKPAPLARGRGLLMAPMFVVAEALFSLGYFKQLKADIERQVGPTRLRNLAMPMG